MTCINCNKSLEKSLLWFDIKKTIDELMEKSSPSILQKIKYLKGMKFNSLQQVYGEIYYSGISGEELGTLINNAEGEIFDERYPGKVCKKCHALLKKNHIYNGKIITEGSMFTSCQKELSLPLKSTEVKANITGLLAEVEVLQKFYNNLNKNIEAVYVFPLPHESAVNFFEIKMGGKIIKGEVREREEARRNYEEARDDNKKAALLEQERPNIFTMSLANIEPGQEIFVTLKYYEIIKYEDNEYEFMFPMTVMPRYNTSFMEKISPPVKFSSKDERDIKISVTVSAGFEIAQLYSPTHRLNTHDKEGLKKEITLASEKVSPDKDFILKYVSKGNIYEKSMAFYREKNKAGKFIFTITPKFDYGPEELIKREIIFVIDRSSSMMGIPMREAKKSLKSALTSLRPDDIFNIISFNLKTSKLSESSLTVNEKNFYIADEFINKIYAWDGTDILNAINTALAVPETSGYLRYIVFLTDGGVENEEDILKKISKSLCKIRMFTFGIGPSVNRYLLDKMAKLGKGTAQFITRGEDIEEAMEKFIKQSSSPVLQDISLEFEGINVSDVYPSPIPDLYAGRVLQIVGRFYGFGKGKVILKSKTEYGEFKDEIYYDFPEEEMEYSVIDTVWAGKRVDHLLDRQREYPKERSSIRDEIIGLGLKYNLVTPYTSLIAIEKRDNGEKEIKEILRIDIPSLLPSNLSPNVFIPPVRNNSFMDKYGNIIDYFVGVPQYAGGLDAMPGKQMAIDISLNQALVDPQEAKINREMEMNRLERKTRMEYMDNLSYPAWIIVFMKAPIKLVYGIIACLVYYSFKSVLRNYSVLHNLLKFIL